MARLSSDFWVSAYLRRCAVELIPAMLRRRGSAEAGAILVKIDYLDGTAALHGPTPQAEVETKDEARSFTRMHKAERMEAPDVEARLKREVDFDPDVWIVEVESRDGRTLLE